MNEIIFLLLINVYLTYQNSNFDNGLATFSGLGLSYFLLESIVWTLPFFKHGYNNNLEIKDLYNCKQDDLSEPLGDELERNWENEIIYSKKHKQKPSLLRAIRKTFIKSCSIYGLIICFQVVILRSLQPILLSAYINYFDPINSGTVETGWLLSVGFIFITFLNILSSHHTFLAMQRIGMRCRIACGSLIYRKILRLNKSSQAHTPVGQIINLLSNDVQRFDIAACFIHYIWIMPLHAIAAGFLMYEIIGIAAIAGIIAIVLQSVLIQGYLSRWQGKLRFKIATRTDYRVRLMNEITSGIRVIKMYAWEKPFEKLVELARKSEIDVITTTSYIRGLSLSLRVITERATLFLTVITYVLLGNRLTGNKVFSVAQIFNSLQLYMSIFFPLGLATFAEAKVSVKRLEEFLLQEENLKSIPYVPLTDLTLNGTVKISNAKASWIPTPIIDTLSNINLHVKPGILCVVVGPVGAGKSSLLQMILQELPLNSGKLEVVGHLSYASQEPWLFVSSVRNNILFGQPYVKVKYQDVIRVCALERDFELLPYGDRTLVGEKGVSLSGGQRARINLARAVYRNADIYLFDDPLSAVDTHVGKHLFKECIMKYLSNKTRILITHQLHYLKQADLIVVLNNGQVEKVGTYEELSENELAHLQSESTPEETPERVVDSDNPKKFTITSKSTSIDEDEGQEPQETQELMEKGAISNSLYIEYFKAGAGILLFTFFVVMLLIAQAACNGGDLWLTHWTNKEEVRYLRDITSLIPENITSDISSADNISTTTEFLFENDTNLYDDFDNNKTIFTNSSMNDEEIPSQTSFIYVYAYFIIAAIILTILRSFIFFKICMNSSRTLHNNMFANVLQATMRFFDTNPSGRILNRFSKDIGAIDEIMPLSMHETIQIFLVMSGILIMVFIITPWMIVVAVFLAIMFYWIKKIYLASAQDVKRLEAITKAPAFSHITATLSGLSTIRASSAQTLVSKEFDALQDQHSGSWILFITSTTAFGFFLDIISMIFLAITTFQFLIFNYDTTLSGSVGLAISQSLILTGMLQFGIKQTAEVASHMTSVERIIEYTKVDKEGPFESTQKPHRDWPQQGIIHFKNMSLRYVPEEAAILHNLNISIKAGEKIGIVGRTGAGKSSLIAALFRLALVEGTINVDGIDTHTIGLNDLRKNISIIPQEPVLFSTSLRKNLDPFETVTDEMLWKALGDVELKDAVDSLDHSVTEGGSNFSAGQRQLLCLARAIIKNKKILVMDEATANVDPQTDSLIQTTIRKNFKSCTVLTIAHRLNTIMDSDRVLVMDAGKVVEFGAPYELLQNTSGYFSGMVKETGRSMESKLVHIARDAYENALSKENGAEKE